MEHETADRSTTPIRRLFVGTQTEDNCQRASRRREDADARLRRRRKSSPVQRRSDADRRPFDDYDDRRSRVVHRRSSVVTRTQIPSCKGRRHTTTSSNAMVEYYDSDRDEDRTLKPSSTCRSKRRVRYRCVSSSQSDSDGDADATLRSSSIRRSRPASTRSSSTERRLASTVSTSKLSRPT